MKGPIVRAGARAASVLALLAAVLAIRVWVSSGVEIERGDSSLRGGDVEGAIEHYRRAASWYFPGNARAASALEALHTIAEDTEARGETDLTLAAERSVHAAITATRWLVVPNADVLSHADAHIARLMAAGAVPPADARRSPDERADTYRRQLAARHDVRAGWALVAWLGLVAWIVGAWGVGQRGVDAEARLVGDELRRWSTVWIAGFGMFVLGLALA